MYKVILLVCVSSIAPGDCQPDTALYLLNGPDARNEISCGMQSQAFMAQTWMGQTLGDDEYVKVVCRPNRPKPAQEEAAISG